jgi:putative phage-type endonuclease
MLQPGTSEWLQFRCGSVGASDAPSVVRRIKSGGYSADRESLLAAKVLERLTNVPVTIPKTFAMLQGQEREPEARLIYSMLRDIEVEEIDPVPHPRIQWSHASPDGYVGALGLVEIKCPQPAAHLDTLLTETISGDYMVQMQWQMAVTGRDWCDYASFNPDFPSHLQLWIKRVPRDQKRILELEREVQTFIKEIQLRIDRLSVRYEKAA